jgi:RimJ/RimL family protein N-acetyltransferase
MEGEVEVRKYVGGSPRTHKAAAQKNSERMQPVEGCLRMWATILKTENRYIGGCGLYSHLRQGKRVDGKAVLVFYLARPRWGRGFAIEAGTTFVRFGFDQINLNRIVANVQAENLASIRVLEKLGFIRIETEKGVRPFDHFELRRSGSSSG